MPNLKKLCHVRMCSQLVFVKQHFPSSLKFIYCQHVVYHLRPRLTRRVFKSLEGWGFEGIWWIPPLHPIPLTSIHLPKKTRLVGGAWRRRALPLRSRPGFRESLHEGSETHGYKRIGRDRRGVGCANPTYQMGHRGFMGFLALPGTIL